MKTDWKRIVFVTVFTFIFGAATANGIVSVRASSVHVTARPMVSRTVVTPKIRTMPKIYNTNSNNSLMHTNPAVNMLIMNNMFNHKPVSFQDSIRKINKQQGKFYLK